MDVKILEQIKKTAPDFVWNGLNEDYSTDAIIKTRDSYNLKQSDVDAITDIIGVLTLKNVALEKAKDEIKTELNLDDQTAKEITLIVLQEILYPIKDFFPGIEDEILKLGGEIPKEKPKRLDEQMLKREEEIEEMWEGEERGEEARMADAITNKPIEELMKEFPQAGEQTIGSQKAIEVEGLPVPMRPMIKYWMKDYRDKTGYGWHSNIDRVQYVYHDKNTKNMNEEERRQLNLVLKSLDEGISLPYSVRMRKIDFSKVSEE